MRKMISYKSSSLAENQANLNTYVDGIAIPYDDFLEEHIFNSEIYSIFMKTGMWVSLENWGTWQPSFCHGRILSQGE